MMHGVLRPAPEPDQFSDSWLDRARSSVREWRTLLLVVFVPTMLVAAYYYLLASDQYESETHFSISQGAGLSSVVSTGLGQLVGLSATSPSQIAAENVSDFLRSHDAIAGLSPKIDLSAIFQRPEADIGSRLRDPQPTPELLLRYYRRHVRLNVDSDTGLVTLRVRTFRRSDSYALAQALLALGENRINNINSRSYEDAVASARRQLGEAENQGAQIRRRMTTYRQSRGDVDPNSTAQAQLQLVADLKAQLVAATAKLDSYAGILNAQSPQYQLQARQVQILRNNIASQSRLLAGGQSAIATNIGGFEDLEARQEFAVKRFDAASAALPTAREEARRQQLYLIRVVEPNQPVKSLFPKRGQIVLTVFVSLLIAYGIGWLIAAGVREHAA